MRPAGGPGSVCSEVVERVVVEVEALVRAERISRVGNRVGVRTDAGRGSVSPAGGANIAVRIGPAARVPGPGHVSGAELVADGLPSLGRKLEWVRRCRLVCRLDGVDSEVPTGHIRVGGWQSARLRQGFVRNWSGCRVKPVAGRHSIAGQYPMLRRGSVRIRRRRSGDEPLVVEERSAAGALEEIVRDRVVRVGGIMQVFVNGQGRGVVVTHGQPARVAAGDVAILLAVVELVLLLIKLVHDVAGAAAGKVVWAGN